MIKAMELDQQGRLLDFIFQKKYTLSSDKDSIMLAQLFNEYDVLMEQIDQICACNAEFSRVIQSNFLFFCDTVKRICFDFSYDLQCTGLFALDEDIENLMEFIWLEAVVGTCKVFVEDMLEYINTWRSQVQKSSQTKKSAISKKGEAKTRPNIPRRARDILEAWFRVNVDSPYPRSPDKERLCILTGLPLKKIDNWFINERSRKWHLYKRNSGAH